MSQKAPKFHRLSLEQKKRVFELADAGVSKPM